MGMNGASPQIKATPEVNPMGALIWGFDYDYMLTMFNCAFYEGPVAPSRVYPPSLQLPPRGEG